ncbi:ABC transporter substrate-binding protein [Agromyces atrinae]|uniref:ABC transporter substrate-binding protein n=1 Tax=Agromyces atrinae TaxID=592376 RepID=A0A4Q2M6G8_9MICO|nr:ABC transporter substrate-binding protein [Agromyces atrinae]NYD68076.1 peptide/nickel transport system substrate-binding protein [Agromyces atrinae]RXZ87775.1 ABC transporter substrate-binding protein [Agromyces atrinae]
MKRSARLVGAAAVTAAAALVFSACSAPADDADAPAVESLVIDKSFDLVTADPARMFETTGGIVLHAVYDSLLTFADGNAEEPLPSVASEWEVNADATEYTFTIRDGITFSDGTPLTAADVVYSLDRVKNIQGNGSFLLDGLSVASPDESTVVITSETPNTAVPAIVTSPTLGIVNSALVTENGGTDAEGAADSDTAEAFLNETSAGSGPYMLESFDTTTETVLVANPEYWGEAPVYDRVVLRNTTAEAQLMDIQSGTAHVALDLGSDQIAGLSGDTIVSTSSSPTIFFLFANANSGVSEITSSPDFREAVKYGLDYDGILELAGEGAERAYGIVPSSYLGALGADGATERDVERATAAAAKLGPNPTINLEYASDFSSNGLSMGPFAERIAAQLAEVGITVNLTPGPIATTLESYRAGTEQMGLWLWNPDYPDSADYLAFGPGEIVGLRAGWAAGSDPELEAVMAEVSTETDAATREELYQEFQKLHNEAGVIIPLFQPAASVVSTSAVGEVLYDPVFSLDIAAIGR